MSIKEDISWFKQQFGSDIQAVIEDTPFRTELFVAIALQETGYLYGFGIFQYDIQFFKENPSFFLDRKWFSFDECLKLCLQELWQKLVSTYGRSKTSLTDTEMVYVAIAYNRGRSKSWV